MFEAVRKGEVRVLIGSTSKMGAGTNVQDKLVALHHLDVPWRPSDVIQREGRILRQNNKNERVRIFKYVTERSFDSYSWQTIENKQRFISQIMSGQSVARTADDIDEKALTYAEIKAIATGDPRIMRKSEIDMEVNRLETLFAQYRHNRYRLQDNIMKHIPQGLAKCQEQAAALEKDIVWRDKNSTPEFAATIGGKTFDERKDAGNLLVALAEKYKGEAEKAVGYYRGFQILAHSDKYDGSPHLSLKNNLTYGLEFSADSVGLMMRIENRISKLEAELSSCREQGEKLVTQLEVSKVEYEKPFDYTEQLTALQKEQQELTAALNLDKTDDVVGGDAQSGDTARAAPDDEQESA